VGDDGRLIGAAAGDENGEVRTGVAIGPEQRLGVARVEPLPVPLKPSVQIGDRFRVNPLPILAGDGVIERIVGHGTGDCTAT
jgi:hypothetical protein